MRALRKVLEYSGDNDFGESMGDFGRMYERLGVFWTSFGEFGRILDNFGR